MRSETDEVAPTITARRTELVELIATHRTIEQRFKSLPEDRSAQVAALTKEHEGWKWRVGEATKQFAGCKGQVTLRLSQRHAGIASAKRLLESVTESYDKVANALQVFVEYQTRNADGIAEIGSSRQASSDTSSAVGRRLDQLVAEYDRDLPAHLQHLGPRPPANTEAAIVWRHNALSAEWKNISGGTSPSLHHDVDRKLTWIRWDLDRGGLLRRRVRRAW